jgi:poly-gamma-glutamate synthase PgsB/CapB
MELFIFRPYDKATIWEQRTIVKLAASLEVQVLMWECMALNPRYVRILERVWMKDDITTLTNTYPDHEDIQGPAGVNIPQVMVNFIPHRKTCFTAAEQMLPILEQGAKEQNADLHAVNWREVEFLTDDVLGRFPYREHPANVALVLKMAEHLGIDRDFALKEIPDNVVPDMGVLKTYPTTAYLGRKLEFTLGNSANERRGFMSNWTRTGFDKHKPEEADVWITTCVNNRADRIPRSKVFANILVMDISAHKHFLIGTNLAGLYGYIQDSLNRRLEGLFLIEPDRFRDIPQDEFPSYIQIRLTDILEELKVEVRTVDEVLLKLCKMLEGLDFDQGTIESLIDDFRLKEIIEHTEINSSDIDITGKVVKTDPAVDETLSSMKTKLTDSGLDEGIASSVADFLEKYIRMYNSLDNFNRYLKEKISSAPGESIIRELNDKVRELARNIFNYKLEIIMNPASTGDQIIDRIARCSPPGFTIRIMGTQNIKGTGLDFAYRWLALGKVVEMTGMLESEDERTRMEAIRWFAYYKDYGILGCKPAIDALERAKNFDVNQNLGIQQQIEAAIIHVKKEHSERLEQLGEVKKVGPITNILSVIEQVLDTRDSKKRRRKADEIMRDLVEERVSHERSATVLRDLTKRQKGGWFEYDLRNFLSNISSGVKQVMRMGKGETKSY